MLKHLIQENNYLKFYPNLLNDINEIQNLRNKFAHSIVQIEKMQDYSSLDSFTLLKTDKYDAKDFARTNYKLSEHKNYLDRIRSTINTLAIISNLKNEEFN